MKHAFYLLLVSTLFMITACLKQSKIGGVIVDPDLTPNTHLEMKLHFSHYGSDSEKFSYPISKNGRFMIAPNVNTFRYASINYENVEFTLLISPYENTKIIIDNDSINSTKNIHFHDPINSFLQNRPYKNIYAHYDSLTKEQKHIPNELIKYVNNQKKIEFLNLEKIRDDINENSYLFLKSELYFYYLNLIIYSGLNYMWYIDYEKFFLEWGELLQSTIKDGIKKQDYFAFNNSYNFFLLQTFQFTYEIYKKNKSHDFWVKEANLNSYQEYLNINKYDKLNLDFYITLKNILDNKKLEKALANRLLESIEFDYYENIGIVYDYFKSEYPHSVYLQEITDNIAPILKFNKNEKVDGIIFFPINHNYNSIDDILKHPDFINKTVVIDIWGSWCSSCRTEFKYLPKLKKELINEDVVFLYIADQKNHSSAKWKEVVNYHQVKGYHILGNKKLISNFWSYNKNCLGYYPTYMIINKNNIISCAPLPSSRDQLLNQIIQIRKK